MIKNNINTIELCLIKNIKILIPFMVLNAIVYYISYIIYKTQLASDNIKNLLKIIINITGKILVISIVLICILIVLNYVIKYMN